MIMVKLWGYCWPKIDHWPRTDCYVGERAARQSTLNQPLISLQSTLLWHDFWRTICKSRLNIGRLSGNWPERTKKNPKREKKKNIKKTAPDITHWGSWVPSGVRGTCNIAYNVSIKTLQCGFSIACNIHEEFIIWLPDVVIRRPI